MKRLAFLLLLLAASCGPAKRLERQVVVSFADYRPYQEIGFFISPDPYSGGPFESLGEIAIRVEPARDVKGGASDDGVYIRTESGHETIQNSELLDIAVSEAIKREANGIVNYKVIYPTSMDTAYTITGLCIRRL